MRYVFLVLTALSMLHLGWAAFFLSSWNDDPTRVFGRLLLGLFFTLIFGLLAILSFKKRKYLKYFFLAFTFIFLFLSAWEAYWCINNCKVEINITVLFASMMLQIIPAIIFGIISLYFIFKKDKTINNNPTV